MADERNSGHTTLWVSRDFRDSLAEKCSKGQTYEEYLEEQLDLNEVDLE